MDPTEGRATVWTKDEASAIEFITEKFKDFKEFKILNIQELTDEELPEEFHTATARKELN